MNKCTHFIGQPKAAGDVIAQPSANHRFNDDLAVF